MSHTNPPPHKATAGQAPPPAIGSAREVPPPHDPHDEVAHEQRDVEIGPVIVFGISLFMVVAIVGVLMYGLQWALERQAAKNDPVVSPLARPPVQMPSTTDDPYFGEGEGPRLITREPAVLAKQRAIEAETLGTYGWVDQKTGVARIPIEEAKKLILQRGLPARADAVADPTLGTRRAAYGESSSGRTIPTGKKTENATPEPPSTQKHEQ